MTRQELDASALRNVTDKLSFDEIDAIIENLSTGNLSSFLNNDKLNEALEKDAYIINNVFTQTGITKSCEHGAKISSIIKHKAAKLNEATALELLDCIIGIYLENFSKPSIEHTLTMSSQDYPSNPLDFVLLSKHFESGVLAFSSLSWDNLPLSDLIVNESLSQQRQKRSVTSSVPQYNELDTLVDYDDKLETKERVEKIKELLRRQTSRRAVRFWEFVLDRDPQNGFNNTCFNLYSLTFLATNGEVEIFKGSDGEIMIKVFCGLKLFFRLGIGVVAPKSTFSPLLLVGLISSGLIC
ncbi:uncharacterized protein TA05840 [Theileria annulata]|uniref:Uncharacterized protein n=1 Tax=Theileria annulata TaxID=5874 RepID=Q4UI10_THEAN|nr:uncharacterized protein TA05840 [Theileria annulata]CAI73279.1 hypothetical protein, conserved [Theileria annulata]|eukprot:XP_953956.1 hypothetical protein, conserved [Theileria annulata]